MMQYAFEDTCISVQEPSAIQLRRISSLVATASFLSFLTLNIALYHIQLFFRTDLQLAA